MEIFKDIQGYEGLYQVSNYGRVKSLKRKKHRIIEGRLCKGYPRVRLLNSKGDWHDILVHRLVCTTFIENPDNKPNVNHKDFNRSNNHMSNLEWCTQAENLQHARNHGKIKMTEKGKRNRLQKIQKPVIDLQTGIMYDSLVMGCEALNIHRNSEWYRIHRNQKNKRFQYL